MATNPPSDQPEDETTMHVRRAVSGDAAEIGWLVERFSSLLHFQADYRLGARLRSLYDPDDLVQEVWSIALPRLKGLPLRNGRMTPVVLKFLSTTLRFVVSNLVQKHVQGKPIPHQASPGPTFGGSGDTTPLEALPDDITGVVTQVARRERRGVVARAIETLAADDREVVILRAIEQRSNVEAAEALGITPNSAAVRYHRALARLKAQLPGSVFDDIPLPAEVAG